MHVVVAYEGVLVKKDNAPIQEGVDLTRALASVGRVSILSKAPQEAVERFLGVHRVEPIAQVISGCERPGEAPLLIRQIEDFRAGGDRLDTVVLPYPDLVTKILQMRLASVLFLAPGSTPPKYRPDDEGRKTWDEIERDISERTY